MVTDDEYVSEIREVRRRKDTQRSKSSKSTEFESDLLRNKATKNVAGPTESRPFDTDAFRQQVRDEVTAELADAESPFVYDSFDSEAPTPVTVEKRDLPPGWQALADALTDVAVDVTTALMREVVAPLLRDVALPAAKARFDGVRARRRARAVERTVAKAEALGDKPSEVAEESDVTGLSATEVETAEPLVPVSRSEYVRFQLELRLAEDYAKARFDGVRARRRARAVERTVAKAEALGDKPSEVAEESDVTGLSATEVETAEPLVPVSRSEYVRFQLELRLAEDYAAQRRWLLARADVQDEDLTPELERSIALMLEGRGPELDDDERAAVAAFLQGSENPSGTRHAFEIERAGEGRE